ncbi:reverse transcriptase domain-containing protein [Tanacetum coccineum]
MHSWKERVTDKLTNLFSDSSSSPSSKSQKESAYSESRTMSPRRQRHSHSPRHNLSVFTRLRRERSRLPRHEYTDKARKEGIRKVTLKAKIVREGTGSLNQEERSPVSKMTISPNLGHVKTYNGSEDPEDHLKIFQAAAKTERWSIPTWCHMFNSTLTGNARVWFDDLPPESIDSYNDLREAFLKNYLQQKKCIRDPIVLHNIKQRDGESTKDFIQRYKSENGNVKGAPECMRISGFVHGITNPELIKRFHEKIPKTVDEMMQVATSFLQGQEVASNQERKKAPPA